MSSAERSFSKFMRKKCFRQNGQIRRLLKIYSIFFKINNYFVRALNFRGCDRFRIENNLLHTNMHLGANLPIC